MLRRFSLQNLYRRFICLLTLGPLSLMLVAGCGGGGSSGSGNGTLQVEMADAPDPSVTALRVTIDRVEAHLDGKWMAIESTPKEYDLLQLVKNSATIGSASLPAGVYTQIRLFPSAATVTDSSGDHPVTIPSGVQTGIKLNVDCEVKPNEVSAVLLDFNVCKSLIKQGNGSYRLQPVIPAVVKVLSGTVTGSVTSGGAPKAGAEIRAIYKSGAGYPVDTEVNSTASLSDGTYKLWALLPGTYEIQASFTDPNTNTTTSAKVANVSVTAGANTDVGVMALQ